MSEQTIGRCSICGGDVVGHVGAWWATIPPPPAKCSQCGAVEARGPVIQMVPTRRQPDCECPRGALCSAADCPRSHSPWTYSAMVRGA